MFGPPGGGEWGDQSWTGWWGDDPPYHNDVFILTHHPRRPVEMEGGTVYHFVTDGIERAVERAKESAGGQDVRPWGGAQVVQQCLAAGLHSSGLVTAAHPFECLVRVGRLRDPAHRSRRHEPAPDGRLGSRGVPDAR
jgi:dihydrofolate reductase